MLFLAWKPRSLFSPGVPANAWVSWDLLENRAPLPGTVNVSGAHRGYCRAAPHILSMKQPVRERGTRPLEGWLLPVAVVAIAACVLAAGCTTTPGTQPVGAAPGDTVRVTYRMAFPGSEPFESNENRTPIEFILGSGVMIKGFDQAIVGMRPGETKTVIIPPELAYGQRDERVVGTISTPVLERCWTSWKRTAHSRRWRSQASTGSYSSTGFLTTGWCTIRSRISPRRRRPSIRTIPSRAASSKRR